MAQFLPDPAGYVADELIEQLGAELAARYADAEDVLIREIAKRSYRDIALQAALQEATLTAEQRTGLQSAAARNRALAELSAYRAQTIRELQFLAVETVDKIRRAGYAQQIIDIAAREGEQAAAARLKMAKRLPQTTALTGNASQAVASLTLDLSSRLEVLNQRITRYPQDAYQQVISFTASNTLLGTQTSRAAQQQAVQRFLAQGITGFVDKADRNWRIGSYAEMAGRTAVARAYNDAGIWRQQQSGLMLSVIVGSLDACKRCAPWIGKIVSTDGTTGTVTLPHATEDTDVTVTIDGSLDDARGAGWGHPNDRCQCVAYLPGLSVPQADFKYDEQADKDRTHQRELEVGIRAAKRSASVAGDDLAQRKADNKVKNLQSELRDFTARTGRPRANYREQLHFADGH